MRPYGASRAQDRGRLVMLTAFLERRKMLADLVPVIVCAVLRRHGTLHVLGLDSKMAGGLSRCTP